MDIIDKKIKLEKDIEKNCVKFVTLIDSTVSAFEKDTGVHTKFGYDTKSVKGDVVEITIHLVEIDYEETAKYREAKEHIQKAKEKNV